jgi:hypothetical protein
VYYVASVALMIGALLWMYWTGNFGDLPTWLSLTSQRVVGTMAIASAFGVAQLASSLLSPGREAPARDGESPTAVADWLRVSDPAPAGSSQASPSRSTPT